MKSIFASAFIAMMIASLIIPIYTVNAAVSFSDDFEKGNLSAWTGYRTSRGDAIGASSYRSYTGAYAGRATSNGGGGTEYAYCYQTITTSEICVKGAFYIAQSGIVENGDQIRLITLQSGSTILASVGWEKVNGEIKWFLTANDGNSPVTAYPIPSPQISIPSPQINTWYTVALCWTKDSVNGEARLYLGTANHIDKVCELSGKNTATFGDMQQFRVGLAGVTNCKSTALYFDCVKAEDAPPYNGYLEPILGVLPALTVFSDGFESGRYNAWSGVNTYNGGAASIATNAYSGTYSARFTTDNSTRYGQAYCYKNFPYGYNNWGNEYDFLAFFKLSSASMANNSRIYLIRAWSQGQEVFIAGLLKVNGSLLPFETLRGQYNQFDDENQWVVTDPTFYGNPVALNQWFGLGLSFSLYIHEIYGNLLYNDQPLPIDRIDIGIVKSDNCYSASVYADRFSTYIETLE